MEGDLKDIVLSRLEKRLKDRDEELRGLRSRINELESADTDRMKELEDRVGHLESENNELQITLSEVMKKMGALEALVSQLLENSEIDDDSAEFADPDLMLDGQKDPQALALYDRYVAAKTDPVSLMKEIEKEEKDVSKDALQFFRMSEN